MNTTPPNITATGRVLADEEIDAIAKAVETQEFDVDAIRQRGRPALGPTPSRLVPVRMDSELHDSLRMRAVVEHTTSSEIIRAALRQYLAS